MSLHPPRARRSGRAARTRQTAGTGREDGAVSLGERVLRQLPILRRWAHGRLPPRVRAALDTSDILQDAIAGALGRDGVASLDADEALAAYLRTSVRNRIRDAARRLAPRMETPSAAADEPASLAPTPLETLLARDAEATYRRALSTLRHLDRELIVAYVELGYSHEQIGVMLAMSSNAARVAVARAMRRLAARMGDG